MKISRTTRTMLAATALLGTLGVGFVAGHAAPTAPVVMTVSNSNDAPTPTKTQPAPPADVKVRDEPTKAAPVQHDGPESIPTVADTFKPKTAPSAPETPAKAQGGTSTPDSTPAAADAPAPAADKASCK